MAAKTFVCPFCCEDIDKLDVRFRCTNPKCSDVDDVELTEYEKGKNTDNSADYVYKKGKTCIKPYVDKKTPFPRKVRCSLCNTETSTMVCPKCHNKIPGTSIDGEGIIISVIGSRDTGKSHFIGVLVNELQNRVSVALGGGLMPFEDTMERYKKDFYNRLYESKQKLDMTKTAMNQRRVPLIFTLQMPAKKSLFSKADTQNVTLVFYDTAGEDLKKDELVNTYGKYIAKSDGIIFLVDPLQAPTVVNQLNEKSRKQASSVEWQLVPRSDEVMARVSKLIRDNNNIRGNKKIKIPVAVVFSKYDMINQIIPEGMKVADQSPHCAQRAFDIADCRTVNNEIKSLLQEWDESSFVSQIELNYADVSFFAVSSLGLENCPKEDGTIDRPRPHRIEDPVLWILKEKSIINTIGK